MPNISLNIPPKTALLALGFGMIYYHADKNILSLCEDDTYKNNFISKIKRILTADDFVSLRALFKIKSAVNDILTSDFSFCDRKITPEYLSDLFCPVMGCAEKDIFLSLTGGIRKLEGLFSSPLLSGGLTGGLLGDILSGTGDYSLNEDDCGCDDESEFEDILSIIKSRT